jgi:hypothetical protein
MKNATAFDTENQEKTLLDYALDVIESRVSVFDGAKNPLPVADTPLIDILNNIKSGKYQKQVTSVRALIGDKTAYTKAKERLPAFTPSSRVSYRGLTESKESPKAGPHNLLACSRSIVFDIDKKNDEKKKVNVDIDMQALRDDLERDDSVLFVFWSPSDEGLKVGFWNPDINGVEAHSNFYLSGERYLKERYGVVADQLCKDVIRLCYVSYDPSLYLNREARPFDIDAWRPALRPVEPPPRRPVSPSHLSNKYAQKVLETACRDIATAPDGEKHLARRNDAIVIGGYVAGGHLDETEALNDLNDAVLSNTTMPKSALKTVKDGFEYGKTKPLEPPAKNDSERTGTGGHSQERTEPPRDDEWEAPIPLGKPRPEPMPENLIPGPVGEMVKAVSAFTETPYELGAGLSLAAVAACVAGKIIVQVKPEYSEPLNIMVAAALETGNRKSGVLEKIFGPHIQWEAAELEAMLPEIKRVALKNRAVESRILKLNTSFAKAKEKFERDNLMKEIEEAANEMEPEPVPPRVIFDDITPEHMGTMMALHNGRMNLISDEGGYFDILAGRYSKNGDANLDLFLKGHSGSPVRVDRGSRPPVTINNPALSMGIAPQPATLIKLGRQPGFRERGVLGRIGFLMPQSLLGYRTGNGPAIPAMVFKNYNQFIKKLLDMPHVGQSVAAFDSFECEAAVVNLQILKLAPAAYHEYEDFKQHIEPELRPGGQYEFVKDWCAKLPGFAVRLAGLLHIMGGGGPEISLETMGKALELAYVFLEHTLYVFDLLGADESLDAAKKIWSWVERTRSLEFSKSECFNALKGSFPNMAAIEPGFKALEEHNHIVIVKETPQGGGRPSYICHVNPALAREWF